MFTTTKYLFVIAMLVTGLSTNSFAATFYVKSGGASGGNGSSWAKAFNNLDTALSAVVANPGSDQIWIAAGTYSPKVIYTGGVYAGAQPSLATFNLPSNLAIYGGFAGSETKLSQRNLANNPTILSGKLSGGGKAYHVLTANGVTGVVLDSLIVRDGLANGPDFGTTSGPPQFSLVDINYTFAAGAGLLARHAVVTCNNTQFVYNTADATNVGIKTNPILGSPAAAAGGGAIAAMFEDTLVTVTNSLFDHNNSTGSGGNGGALNTLLEASFNISSSTFSNNSANRIGGAIHGKDAGTITITSSAFTNNMVTGHAIGDESGGGIGAIDTNLSVYTSVFTGNASSVTAGGGAIFFHQPFDDEEAYVLNVSGSFFSNNQSGAVGGGAINISGFHPNAGTQAKVSNSAFSNNTSVDGGAMYVDGIPSSIVNCIFNGNQAYFQGGAILEANFSEASQLSSGLLNLNDRTLLTINNSAFIGNSIAGFPANFIVPIPPCPAGTTPSQFPQCVFNVFAGALSFIFLGTSSAAVPADGMRFPGGGAIASAFAGNLNISNSIFWSNSAPNASGGALLIGGTSGAPIAMGQDYVKITNSVCSGNTASLGNDHWIIDAENLNNTTSSPNGVNFISDGSCRLGN